ncbi:MAG TPA: hypothetical protein VN663_14360 [Ramlibacter sp.]|nr:hypothetical protein [Ramlibacter sp.]
MTPEQLQTLGTEVRNDPEAIGYAQYLPDSPGLVADLLNAPTRSMVKPLPSGTAKIWAAAGPYAKIVDASENRALNIAVRASCLVVRDEFISAGTIHIDQPKVRAMFDAWIVAGVITADEHADLIAEATVAASRAEQLGLPPVTIYDLIDSGVIA